MKSSHFVPVLFAVVMVSVTLSGCETTGDPNQGGLFGWSSSKANDRAAALNNREYNERNRLAAERRKSRQLSAQEQAVGARLSVEKLRE